MKTNKRFIVPAGLLIAMTVASKLQGNLPKEVLPCEQGEMAINRINLVGPALNINPNEILFGNESMLEPFITIEHPDIVHSQNAYALYVHNPYRELIIHNETGSIILGLPYSAALIEREGYVSLHLRYNGDSSKWEKRNVTSAESSVDVCFADPSGKFKDGDEVTFEDIQWGKVNPNAYFVSEE